MNIELHEFSSAVGYQNVKSWICNQCFIYFVPSVILCWHFISQS